MDTPSSWLEGLQAEVDAEREAVLWLRSEVRALRRYARSRRSPWRVVGLLALVSLGGALVGACVAWS